MSDESSIAAVVTDGSVTVRVRRAPVRVAMKPPKGAPAPAEPQYKTYESFQVEYYEASCRKLVRANNLEAAKKRAKDIAARLRRDGARAEHLTENECRLFVLARSAVKDLNLEVDEVCRRYAELHRRIKNGTPEQAADFFNDHGQRLRHGARTKEVYDELILDLDKRGVGDYHKRDTERYLSAFVEAFPGEIGKIQTAQIDLYLGGLSSPKARSKNNVRDAVIGFFNFAQQKGFLPGGLPHAAEATTEFRDPRKKIESEADVRALLQPNDIFTPAEMKKLLDAAEPELRPTLEIKAFSGVRTEEMVRLWWLMVDEGAKCIRVPDAVGKIDARQVPLLDNLQRRLAVYPAHKKTDRICVNWSIANSLANAWKKLCAKAGVKYKKNAFRNSYFTYRLALIGDDGRVAQEGGTSKEQLQKEYLSKAPVSRATAEEWFAL